MLEVAPTDKLTRSAFTVAGPDTTQMTAYRGVDLSGLSEGLSNVKSYNPYSALVGSSGGTPAVLGAVDPAAVISNEVRSYVATLIRRGQVDLTPPGKAKPAAKTASPGKTTKKAAKKAAKKTAKAARKGRKKRGAGYLSEKGRATHVLRRQGQEVVLERIGFSCGCHPTASAVGRRGPGAFGQTRQPVKSSWQCSQT